MRIFYNARMVHHTVSNSKLGGKRLGQLTADRQVWLLRSGQDPKLQYLKLRITPTFQ